MSEELLNLKKELERKNNIISGYEKVLKLNEQELQNSDAIIKMYETIVEYSRNELKDARETAEANMKVSNLSREELIAAFNKISEIEKANQRLKEQAGL